MILENKMDTWMYGNKTWIMPKEDGEGYIEDIENNLSVLGLMDGKSIHFFFFYLQFNRQQVQSLCFRIHVLINLMWKKIISILFQK